MAWSNPRQPVANRDYLTIQLPEDYPTVPYGTILIKSGDLIYIDPLASLDDFDLCAVELVPEAFQAVVAAQVIRGVVLPPDVKLLGPVVGVHHLHWYASDRPTSFDAD